MARAAIASGSQIAADAGASAAANGGNAVDAAIAASLASMCTDPGIVALGAGSFIAISPPAGPAVVIDAYAEVPGRATQPWSFGSATDEIHMEYGGGTTTLVGHGTVATPGSIAGFGRASALYGAVEWSELIEPSIYWAERGFPLSGAAAEYMTYAHELIFGWHPESRAILHHEDGTPVQEGEFVHCPGLAEALTTLATEGPESFYTGTLGRLIAADNMANGGLLSADDLAAYEPIVRDPLQLRLDDWTVSTNPGPAIGGAAVAAFLALTRDVDGWDAQNVARMVVALAAVLGYRHEHLDDARDREAAVDTLMELAGSGDAARLLSSPSTVHASAVDEDGLACSISTSSGYGSGAIVPGTGIWLNNSLGEVELLPAGMGAQPPGSRLPSNMAPSIARRDDGTVLAIGSPGASRISSAVGQVMLNHLRLGMPLADAVAHPRLHVELFQGASTAAHEPGVDISRTLDEFRPRPFGAPSMYFGGTHAAAWSPDTGLEATADPRRAGGTAVAG